MNNTARYSTHERGDVSVSIALMLTLIMLSSTIVLSLILSRQIKLTQDIIASERALYAADAGIEEGHYEVFKLDISAEKNISGTLDYPDGSTTEYEGIVKPHVDQGVASACIPRMSGKYRSTERRLATGPVGCENQ